MEQNQAGTAGHALWRRIFDFPLVALFVAVGLYLIAYAAAILVNQYFLPPTSTARGLIGQSAVTIALAFLTYKYLITHLGEQHRDDLPPTAALRNLGIGLAIGAAVFAVVVGVAALTGVYAIVGPGGTQELLQDLISAAIVPAFMEELLFRGILFRWIEEFGGSWAALVITSALFGLAHILNPNATWFSSFAIAMEAGVLLGGAYMLTRNLWMPMGLHAAWNFTQGFIFDVNVSGLEENGLVESRLSGPELLSGGSFGLEASVIALVIATAAGVWLVVLAVRRGQLIHPWWVRRRRLSSAV